ncbi:MAG: TusE/DsrC/DsvC family sulfur relay protein [Planctomycetota bacterium]|nr:TusE/DsrC/DsvC family sulfur relay protein [Planctomycetota bacterium]
MKIGDKELTFDKEGFLQEPLLWDQEVARAVASEEGITEMSDNHWAIVNFIRKHWEANGAAPPIRQLCQETKVSIREVYKLFKSGPARGACRVAGLPKPDGCV